MYDKLDAAGWYPSAAAVDAAESRVNVARGIGKRNLSRAAYRLIRADARLIDAKGCDGRDFLDAPAESIDPRSADLQCLVATVRDPWGTLSLSRLVDRLG